MKFPLHLMLTASAAPLSACGYVHPSTTGTAHNHRRYRPAAARPRSSRLHYKEPSSSSDGKSDNDASSSDGGTGDASNVWSVLANTERWISDTLDRSNKSANARNASARKDAESKREQEKKEEKKMHFADEKKEDEQSSSLSGMPRVENPYARKEVSYVCETGADLSVVVGGVFRRVREARELGENHGRGVEARLGETSQPITMRQTNVVVIPNCEDISKFQTFDKLIQAINQARRASRDFVLKKRDDDEDGSKDWVVSINCAHLHPQYGMPTPSEQLASLKHEEEEGEVDVNLQEYKKLRDAARRSPYPSVIVEVQSTPPPDFGARRDEAAMEAAAANHPDEEDGNVTSEDVKKLEALFGMSAAKKAGSADDPFYDALGEAFGNKQVVSQTPLSMAQSWVLQNDPAFNQDTSTFTNSNTRHVDATYEYVFNNLAMLSAAANDDKPKRGQKSYVVLPNFVPTSATSFDRFAGQVSNIIRVMPNLAEKVMVSTFHPEHVVTSTRAPVPIVVITWK